LRPTAALVPVAPSDPSIIVFLQVAICGIIAIWSMNLQGVRPFGSPEEADCRDIDGDFGHRGRARH
jgi:hypothetical protein